MMMGFGGLGILLMLLFWVVVVLLAVALLSRLFPALPGLTWPPSREDAGEPSANPLDILRQSYARGELSRAEYDEMRTKLLE